MCWRSDARSKLRGVSGQATVEAAFLIPVMFVALLILLQPSFLLYGHVVMQHAASEGCRLLVTAPDRDVSAYVRRHLAAVPDVPVLHDGDWEVSGLVVDGWASVSVSHSVRPLPVLGAFLSFAGATDASGLCGQSVTCRMPVRAEWMEGVAAETGPDDWVSRWEEAV